MRKLVYDRALNDGNDADKALLLATIFKNAYFMGCEYNQDVLNQSQKYWESDWVQHYVNVSQAFYS